MPLTTEAVLAMQHGAKLNKAVHDVALGRIGRPKPYSTNVAEAAQLIDLLPIFGARASRSTEGFDENRPYLGGVLDFHKGLKAYTSIITVKCSTLPLALCKAALLYSIQPKDKPALAAGISYPKLGSRPAPVPLEPMPKRTMELKLPPKPDEPEKAPTA